MKNIQNIARKCKKTKQIIMNTTSNYDIINAGEPEHVRIMSTEYRRTRKHAKGDFRVSSKVLQGDEEDEERKEMGSFDYDLYRISSMRLF